MKTKITFGMIVFNGEFVLKQCLEAIYPYAYQIVIAEGPVAYWQKQGFTTSLDKTNEILKTFPDPDKKIVVTHGQFSEKDEQCNAYMKLINPECDYVWHIDSDEIFKPEDIEKVIGLIEKDQYTSVGFKSISFFGGFDNFLTGFEQKSEFIRIQKVYLGSYWKTHRPPTMVHKQKKIMVEKHLDFDVLSKMGVHMYHYSYVCPKQVDEKVQYYRAAVSKQNCIKDYFNKVWLSWVNGNAEQREVIEKKYNGVHEWIPTARGDCKTAVFKGTHPLVIEKDLEQLKREIYLQLRKYTCWYDPKIIEAMNTSKKEWAKLSETVHGIVLKELLDKVEKLVHGKPRVLDLGCGVCPLLDIVDKENYIGVDLQKNTQQIRNVVGEDIKIHSCDILCDTIPCVDKVDVFVVNALVDTSNMPLEMLDNVLSCHKKYVVLHRQIITKESTHVELSESYMGKDSSYRSFINNKDFEKLLKKHGYKIIDDVLSFGKNDDPPNYRSFILEQDRKEVMYFPITWNHYMNAGDARTESLKRMVPDLFNYKTVLYVGARSDRFDYGSDFMKKNCKVTVLEVWKRNVAYLNTVSGLFSVLHGDVKTYEFKEKSFDVVFWWHGPEHIDKALLNTVVEKLEKIAKKLVVLGCPWGKVQQYSIDGNPFEEHRTYIDGSDFLKLGYDVECIGDQNVLGSHITAVKRV